ncbi:MAG: cohesin domain-containing protein [Bacteroidota bacterium]
MKKIYIASLIILTLLGSRAWSTNAPISTIAVVTSSLTTATVNVSATNFVNVSSYNLDIVYDPAYATVTNVTPGPSAAGDLFNYSTSTPGHLTIGWGSTLAKTLTDGSVIFAISFSKVANGLSALTWYDPSTGSGTSYHCVFTDGSANTMNDDPYATYYHSGSLTFTNTNAPITTISTQTACTGTVVNIPITVTNYSGIGSVSLQISYNPSVLTWISGTNTSGMTTNSFNVPTAGTLIIGGFNSIGSGVTMADGSTIYTLSFTYNGGTSALSFVDDGSSCQFAGPTPSFSTLGDSPSSTYYIAGGISQLAVPAITGQAADQTVCNGGNASFSITATGAGLTYQWQENSGTGFSNISNGGIYSGATSSTLTLTGVTSGMNTNHYRCVVSGTCTPTATSDGNALLTVRPTPTASISGTVTVCQNASSPNVTFTNPQAIAVTVTYNINGANQTTINVAASSTATVAAPTTNGGAFAYNLVSVIYQSAPSCSNSITGTSTVTVTPTVGTPTAITLSAGSDPTCQLTNGTTTTTYATTATNNSGGFNWFLSNGSAGSIGASTGIMTWASGFSGSVNIQVTANGCNGPSSQVIHAVTVTATVGTPTAITISAGSEPTCQLTNGSTTTTYATTATNSTGLNWSLSNGSAGSIGATTGIMTWTSGFSGSVDIRVTANGCNGPSSQVVRSVSITPTVGTPTTITVSSGTQPTCQLTNGTTTTTYASTATNSTGFNWSLSNGSAGSIGATTGIMTWVNGFSGTVNIQVTASGCNSPSAQVTRTVNITPTVGIPTAITISSGTEPSCQLINGTTTTTYASTATNSTGYNWSLSNGSAGSIGATTGIMTWANGFSGSVNIQLTANGCNGPSSQVIHAVTVTPTVGTPTTITVSAGSEPTCQLTNGTTTTTYATTATNSTGLNWSLSNGAAGSIGATTGIMTWANGFSGSVDIRVTASGCNGPSTQVIRSASITPTVGTPTTITVSSGTQPTCQLTNGTTTTTYATTAANNSGGFNWSISNGSAGSIGATTGVMTWANGFSGSVNIQVTANGCNSPSAQVIRSVIISPSVASPVFALGASSTRCQVANSVTYTASATNSTGITYELDATSLTGGNSIVSSTGAVTYLASWIGTSVITASAAGCNGPLTAIHTVTTNTGYTVVTQPGNQTTCAGGNVSFSVVANGSPNYQWQQFTNSWADISNNSMFSGATTSTLSITAAISGMNGYKYRCVLSGGCLTSQTDGLATLTVQTAPAITTQPSNTSVCAGNNASYVVVVTGANPTYQWQLSTGSGFSNITNSSVYSGVTSATLTLTGTTAGMNGTNYHCVISGTCTPSVTTNSAMLVVNTAPSISAQAVNQVVCANAGTATFAITAAGTGINYQWQEYTSSWNNLSNGGVYSGALTASLAITNPGSSLSGRQYRCVVAGFCTPQLSSDAATLTVNSAVTITTQAGNQTVCSGGNASFSVVAAGAITAYQWQVYTNAWANVTNGGVYSGAGTATLSITGVTYSYNGYLYRCLLTGSCGNAQTDGLAALTVNTAPSIVTHPSNSTKCSGTNTSFSVSATGTGLTYQWQANTGSGFANISNTGVYTGATTANLVLTNLAASMSGYQYHCVVSGTCTPSVNSNAATLVVNTSVAASVTISSSANSVCAGTSVSFTATPVNGGTPSYHWYKNGLTTGYYSATYSCTPDNNDQIDVVMTSTATCASNTPATSNVVSMTVNPVLTSSVSISTPSNPVCPGTSVTFTAIPVNGGTPTFQWYLNNVTVGTDATTYSFTPANGDEMHVIMTSNALCQTGSPATSNSVTMGVNALITASVSIAPTTSTVCAGTSVTFTATPVTGGTPAYQWYKNNATVGTNSPTYTFVPLNGDQVHVVMTSSAACETGSPATSNSVTVTVNPLLIASVSIAASASSVCDGISVTFTATPVNGGTPVYQWYKNNVTVGTNSPSYSCIPANGDQVHVVMTSDATCEAGSPATSNSIQITVNPLLTASVSIATATNPVCAGTSVTVTATPVNGGTPSYQWYKNTVAVGTNAATYIFTPVNGDQIDVVMTSNTTCVTASPAISNTITMTVNPILTASVSIATATNPVCAGTSVTFTATPANGGTPSYQWYKNTVAVGTNAATYIFTPVNGDQIDVVMTSNASCVTASPATSNTVTMTVNPLLTASVSVSPSANPICAGAMVTYTATSVNGGTPAYQWYKNGLAVGTGIATFDYTPSNGDQFYVVMTSNASCVSGSPATSNTVTESVYPVLIASVTISPSASPVCAGTPVTVTATPVNGGTPTYQWYKNNVAVGTNAATYLFTPVNNDQVYVVMTSSVACINDSPATSNTLMMSVNPLLTASVSVAANANPVCSGTSVTFTASPVNGGTPGYQWYKNNVAVGTNSATYSCVPFNGDQIYVVMTSTVVCGTGSPATSNTITISINNNLTVSVSITASTNAICSGTSVTFTASPVNGGTTPVSQWYKNSVAVGTNSATYSYVPVNGDIISLSMTSSATCASSSPVNSNNISMIVNPLLPASASISVNANPVCSGSSVSFTATVVNGGTAPVYQWYKNSIITGSNSASYSFNPSNGDLVYVVVTSNATCVSGSPVTSNTIMMSVNFILPVSVSISPSANSVCAGTSVTYTATPTYGGAAPSYQWYKNSAMVGTNSATYSSAPANGDQVYVVMTSNAPCTSGNPASSNTVSMIVNPLLPVSVSISASNTVCAGTSVTYTATPANAGTAPVYQWYKNNLAIGTNSATYSYVPLNGDQVKVVLTSNVSCSSGNPASSNTITMIVNPLLAASVSISTLTNPVCAGTSVSFTTTPINAGTAPVYQWYKNTVAVGSNSSTYSCTPLNSDVINVVMTSNATCASSNPATSNAVTMTVNPLLPASVSITASSNPVCTGSSVTVSALAVNEGTVTGYQWYLNSTAVGTNSATYNFIPANGDQVYVVMTSNALCGSGSPATSNTITMGVNTSLPASVGINANNNPVCTGSNVTLTAVPTNGGTAPIYQWFKNTLVVGTNSSTYTYVPVNGDVIHVVMTSNAGCATNSPATSNNIAMTVNPVINAVVIVSASDQNVCAGTSITFTASPSNGGTSPVYQWYKNNLMVGTNSATYSCVPLNGDHISVTMASSASCVSSSLVNSNILTMAVNPVLAASVSIAASSNPSCTGTSVTLTATPVNGGTPVYQWFKNSVAVGTNSSSYSCTPLDGDQVNVVMTSNANCVSGSPANSSIMTMLVNPNLTASVSITESANPVCAGTSVTYTATPVNGGSTPSYQWYVNNVVAGTNNSSLSIIPVNGDEVHLVMTSNASCVSGSPASSNSISMTVNAPVPVSVSIVSSGNPICAGSSVTCTATATNGGTNPTYQWYKNNVAVGTNSNSFSYTPANGDVVSVQMTSDANCVVTSLANSNTITMVVNPVLNAGVAILASENPVCSSTIVSFSATPTNGGTLPVYQWYKNGSPVGTNSATYSYAPVNGDHINVVMTSNASCISGSPATSNTVNMSVSTTLIASVSLSVSANPVCSGSAVTFTASPVNGGNMPTYQWFKNGTTVNSSSPTYTCIPVNGDQVYVMMASNAGCATGSPATSNTITMSMSTSAVAAVSIAASTTTSCSGESVTFTASPVNGGTSPLYQWYRNNIPTGTNSSAYTCVPVNGDQFKLMMTSNASCVTNSPANSNSITINVLPNLPSTVFIVVNANPVCDGSTMTFTAMPTNGGTLPFYQWFKNNVAVGTDSPTYSFVPTDGDLVFVEMTSGYPCSVGSIKASNTITTDVNPILLPSVSIAASANPEYQDSLVTFTATPTNGGTTPVYQWYNNNVAVGTSSATYAFAPTNGDQIHVEMVSDAPCDAVSPAISNTITMTILPNGVVVSGHVQYANTAHTHLSNVQITLSVNNNVIYTGASNNLGNYSISGVLPGTYKIKATSTHSWGGVNSIDAIIIQRHFAHVLTLSGIYLTAADVNKSNYINSADARMATYRSVGIISSFPSGDWVFDSAMIVVTNNNITRDFTSVCFGDVNGSFNPSIRITPDVQLETSGTLEVEKDNTFEFPVMAGQNIQAGAISLIMNYPSDKMEIQGITIAENQENLAFKTQDGQLKIGWYSLSPLSCKAGEPLFKIIVKLNDADANLQNIRFELEGDCQLADNYGQVFHNVMISMPVLTAKMLSNDISLLENTPNPLQDRTSFNFITPENGKVTITLFNAAGEKVAVVAEGLSVESSLTTIDFNGTSLAQGMYYYRFDFVSKNQTIQRTKKMIITR